MVIEVPKELDHHSAEYIREEADRILSERNIRSIVFDFAKTSFMDSSGIGMIMGRYKSIRFLGGKVIAVRALLRGAIQASTAVASCGFCWSDVHPEPSITDAHITAEGSGNDFSATVTEIRPGTTYYYSAFAESENELTYGTVKTFVTPQ